MCSGSDQARLSEQEDDCRDEQQQTEHEPLRLLAREHSSSVIITSPNAARTAVRERGTGGAGRPRTYERWRTRSSREEQAVVIVTGSLRSRRDRKAEDGGGHSETVSGSEQTRSGGQNPAPRSPRSSCLIR